MSDANFYHLFSDTLIIVFRSYAKTESQSPMPLALSVLVVKKELNTFSLNSS